MIRQLTITAIVVILAITSGSAQDTLLVVKSKNNKLVWIKKHNSDSLALPGRHEVFVNVAPYLVWALGAYGENSRLNAMYKQVRPNYRGAWRMGVGIYSPPWNFWTAGNETYYEQTDSTRLVNAYVIGGSGAGRFALGYEWRGKGRKRLQSYLATDLLFGTYKQIFQIQEYRQLLDSTGEWRYDFDFPSSTGASLFRLNKQERLWQVGASVNVGFRYALNRHWLVAFQSGIDGVYSFGYNWQQESRETMRRVKMQQSDIQVASVLNEVSVVFRF